MWNPLQHFRWSQSPEEVEAQRELLLREAPIPCLWMFGKTGSGKTSVIRYLTGAVDAEIGTGFRPQTKHSELYAFPDDDLPIVRFLDTRGLGEAAYDPTEDISQSDAEAHLIIVTVRATDQAMEEIAGPLKTIRRHRPDRPVLLAITCLHDAYPGEQHIVPDPFPADGNVIPSEIPETLTRCLAAHFDRFDGLFDLAVAIDLTKPEDGFRGCRLRRGSSQAVDSRFAPLGLSADAHADGACSQRVGRSTPTAIGPSHLGAQHHGSFSSCGARSLDRYPGRDGHAVASAASTGSGQSSGVGLEGAP